MESKMKKTVSLSQEDTYRAPLQEWDKVPSATTLKLFHANKSMKEAQIDLIVKKIEQQRENMYLFCNSDELEVRKRKLRNLFITSNKVIKENKASTYRFFEKIQESTQEIQSLDREIDLVRMDVVHYKRIKNQMEIYVNEYSNRYENFLESVARNAPEFNSVGDILNRYETLENCRRDCSELLKVEMDGASEMKNEMMRIMEEKASVLRTLDNSLVMLQVRRKQAKENRKHWERMLEKLKAMIISKALESETLRSGCYDLYKGICRQRRVTPSLKKEDIENQLHFIQKSILFYKEVIRIATGVKQEQQNIVESKNELQKKTIIKNVVKGK